MVGPFGLWITITTKRVYWGRHCAKCFIRFSSFNPHSQTYKMDTIIFAILQTRKLRLLMISTFLQILQPASGARISVLVSLSWHSVPCLILYETEIVLEVSYLHQAFSRVLCCLHFSVYQGFPNLPPNQRWITNGTPPVNESMAFIKLFAVFFHDFEPKRGPMPWCHLNKHLLLWARSCFGSADAQVVLTTQSQSSWSL